MSDERNIVERLRGHAYRNTDATLIQDAADEIERLRAEVAGDTRRDEIADAYRRGVMWARENPPESDRYATKAASDYADKWVNRVTPRGPS